MDRIILISILFSIFAMLVISLCIFEPYFYDIFHDKIISYPSAITLGGSITIIIIDLIGDFPWK